MEKITKEELKNLIGGKALSDDELEKVSGGVACIDGVEIDFNHCKSTVTSDYNKGWISTNEYQNRWSTCRDIYEAGIAACG